jgi:hypothetical protein
MSVNPIGGITNVSSLLQPTAAQLAAVQGSAPGSATAAAAQTAPTTDAAQAWEEAMRTAMGDESAAPAATAAPAPATPGAPATSAAPATALTPQALAALFSGSSSATTSPLITSLSAPSDATTQAGSPSDGDAYL